MEKKRKYGIDSYYGKPMKPTTVKIPEHMLDWLDDMCGDKVFYSRSDAIRRLIDKEMSKYGYPEGVTDE